MHIYYSQSLIHQQLIKLNHVLHVWKDTLLVQLQLKTLTSDVLNALNSSKIVLNVRQHLIVSNVKTVCLFPMTGNLVLRTLNSVTSHQQVMPTMALITIAKLVFKDSISILRP